MFRAFILVPPVVVLIFALASPAVLAQSKEDAIRLHKEAYELREKARSNEDLKKAVEKYEQALKIFEKIGDKKAIGLTANNLGNVYLSWGQYPKAAELYEKSLELSRKAGDPKTEGYALGNLSEVYWRWGQYRQAVEFSTKRLEMARKLGDLAGQSSAMHVLGVVCRALGQYQEAVGYYEKSLELKIKLEDLKGQALVLNDEGVVYQAWGQYQRAMECYERSLELSRKAGILKSQGYTLGNLGNVHKEWGQYQKAVEYYETCLVILRKIGDIRGEGEALMKLGEVHEYQGELAKAGKDYEKVMQIWAKLEVPTTEPKELLGNLYLDTGDMSKAEHFIKEAGTDRSFGRLSLVKSEHSKARVYYEKALQSAEKSRNTADLFTAYTGLGLSCEGMKKDQDAAEHFRKAVGLVEDLRSSLSGDQREKFFDVKVNGFYRTVPYEGLSRVQMRLNKPAEAWNTSEYTKARLFAEAVSRRSGSAVLDVPPDVRKTDEELTDQLAALKKQRQVAYEKNNKDQISALEPQIEELEEKFAAHKKMLREKYPLFAATKYPEPIDLSQTALKPDEWVLAYDVTDSGVLIYLTKGKELIKAWFKPTSRKDLDELVRKFRQPLEIGPDEKILDKAKLFNFAASKKLSDILVVEALSELPKDAPLIIIPDDCLGVVPFEMLVLNDGGKVATDKQIPYVTGAEFFGDRNPISYYQSVTALTLARTFGKQKGSGEKSLVMDDPIFDPDDARFKQLAREKRQANLAAAPDKLLAAIKQEWKTDLVFPRLDRTHDLGEALKKMEPTRTEEYTGMEASKKVLFEKPLDKYNSMVFATHGYFGKDLPGIREPVLVLTLVNQPTGKDGYLRLSEVMGLKLNADIVALTACQTGLGRHISGEGTMGMGRAFQYAGAKSVLMSLWNVSENASVKLVESFFRNMKAGKNKLEALKLARDEIRKEGYDHPFYWAPFILVGEVN